MLFIELFGGVGGDTPRKEKKRSHFLRKLCGAKTSVFPPSTRGMRLFAPARGTPISPPEYYTAVSHADGGQGG